MCQAPFQTQRIHSSWRGKTVNKYTASQMAVGVMEKNKDGKMGEKSQAAR